MEFEWHPREKNYILSLYAKDSFRQGPKRPCRAVHSSVIPTRENGFHLHISEMSDFTNGFCSNFLHANLLKAAETKTQEVSKLLIAEMRVQQGERSLCNCHGLYRLSPNICYGSLSETGYFVTDL